MAVAAGCLLRLRVCRVDARAEVPVIKLWGSLEDTKEEHRIQQSPQAAVFGEQSRPQAAAAVLLGELCLVEVSGEWKRCKVLLKRRAEFQVFLLEEGAITSVSPTRLHKAQASLFFPLPPHTLVCALSGLVPPNGQHWNHSALNYFYSLQDKVITGQVQDLLPQGLVILEASEISQQALLCGLTKTIPMLPSHSLLGCSSITRHTPIPAMNGSGRGAPWQAESMDYCYPRLESGVTEQVVVTHVSEPHSIFCQLLSVAQEFHSLSEAMQHFYTVETGPAFRNPLKLGQPCASRGADGRWYRSLLQEVFQERQLATVIHVDWGREELVPLTCLRPLAADFLRLPVITFHCALYGISDGGMDWELSVIAELRSLLQGKQVSATIQFFNSYKHLYVVTLLAADGCNLNYFFGMQVQNRSPKSDACVIPSVARASLCPEEDEEKIGTPKLPEENFYVSTFSTVELKTGTFYDAMVQYVFDPSNFYVQTEEDAKKHQKMVDFINDMYTKASRLEGIITKPKPGQICCAKFKDGIYYRAEVIACENKQVKVYFLDHGNVELIDWYSIKELPDEFKQLSALANRCCLVDIYPLGESWSLEAIHAFKVAVVHRKLVLYVMSKDLDKYAVEVLDQSRAKEKNVGKALSLAGHAKYEELETFTIVQMGKSGGRKATPSQPVSILGLSETETNKATVSVSDEFLQYSPYEDQLFEPGATIKVIVSHIENPGLFWCQNAAQASALNNLMDSIQMHCILANTAPEPDANACFAKSPKNGKWYRGFITEIPVSETKSNSVQVLYVDYGMTEMVPAVNLRAMESSFFNVKTHAFKCSLYNIIAPLGNNPFCWGSKATNAFRDFAVKAAKVREFNCMFFATAFVDQELINIVDLYTPFENICANLAKRGFATYIFHKTLAPSVLLQSFYYSLHDIKAGSEEEVSITHINPSLEFYCQLLKNTDTLARIAEAIKKSCKKTQRLKLPSAIPLCLAKFTDQQWYRAFICSETDGAEVFFVDYGNTEKVAADDLQPIVHSEHDLLLLPMQAIKCSLSDIPLILPEEVMTWFEDIVWNRALRAVVVAKEADGKLLVELYDGNEQINATLKSKLGLNVPKNALACKPTFCPSSQPSPKFTQQEAKTVNGERKTCESIQGQSSHTRGSNFAKTDSSTALPQRDRSSPGTQMPFEQHADRPALPRDRSSPGTQIPFEQHADRDYNAKNREPSSQKRDTLPFQSNVKRALYQDNRDCSVRRKEVTTFQSPPRNSYYAQPSSQNSKPNFGKELHPKPNPFAKPCGSTPKHPITKISEISTRSISPGEKLCVYASHAKNMFDFYVQTAETGLLDQISDFLNRDKSTFEEVSEKDVNIGDVVCALFDGDKLYYRGVVEQKSAVGLNVLFIDYGNTSVISNCKIYKLPQKLCSIPAQSIHCSINSTKGASSVSNSHKIVEMFFERVFDQQLQCEFIKFKDGKWDVDLYDKRGSVNDLLKPLVEEKGKVTTEFKARQEDVPVNRSFTWNLPKTGKFVKVFTSSVDSPGLFWCQLSTTDFDVLAKQVQEAGEKSVRDDHFIATIKVGSLCNVMYSEDQNWYRALVSKMEADVATVRFVDYGNVENVVKEEIRQLPTTLTSVPTQAFPCCLAGFNVAAGTWTSEGCDYFFQRATEDVLGLTVKDIQNDEMCNIPLALVRLKYNEMDINEEMKRFWQVGKQESSHLAESASSKPDMTEGRQTVEEKQLGAEKLDWPIPSMEDEANRNMGFDLLNTEETEDDTGDSSPRDLRQTANEEGISEEAGDQGIEHLVESKDDQAYERLVETITHNDTLAEDVFETGYECHGGLVVSYSSSLEYDNDFTKHECLAKEEFEVEESATYSTVMESKEPIDDTLQDPTAEHVHKSEDTEKSIVFVLPNENDILEGEKHSACACVVENQVLDINEDATMQILATGVLAESEIGCIFNVDTVEAVVGEVEKSEEAITFVDSVEALEFSDTGVCETVDAITYMDEEDFLAIGEHQEFEAITFVDHVEPVAISEHVEAITYVDSTDALAIGEHEVITFMDSVESITDGDIGECQEVEAMNHVDSVEAMFADIDMNYDFDAITYVDMMEAVAVSEDIVEPVVGDYEEVEDIVEPVVIGEYAELKDMIEPLVIGDYEEVEDRVEPIVAGEYEEVEDRVEPGVIGAYEELEDREPVITGKYEEVEVATFVDSVEAVTTGDITECEKVEAIAYEGSVTAVGDICEHVGLEDIIYVDMVEAVTYMNCVEHAAVGDIECIQVEAEHFSDIDEIKENKTIHYMDSAEPEAGNTDDSEEVKDCIYVTSEVAVVVPDSGEPQGFKAFTSVDDAVAVPDIGESKNSRGDILNTAVESLVVSSQVTVESERALVRDDQLQRDDDATGEGIVKSEDTVEDEEIVVSSGIIIEEVFKTEDFIGITKLERSEDCGPSEDTKECEETLGSRDVTETLEAKQFGNQVWEHVIDVSNEDLREHTIPEITRDVALQHSGQQFQEQDCPGEVEGCFVGEDSEYASSHTLQHQDKQTELFTVYRDQPVAKTSSEVMHGSDGSDSSTGRETLDEKDKQTDIFKVCRDQPGVKTSPDVVYGSDFSTGQETLAMEDKKADLFTVYRDQPAVKTSLEVMYESHGVDSSTDQETLDKEDKQADIFTVCRDQPRVKTSPDVIYGSDDSDSSTHQETLDKEDKQPDLFTVYRDQLGVKTDSEVMYESDGDSLADQDTLNKEDKKASEPCRIHADHQPLAITSTENKNESDLGDTSRDMDDKGKRRSALFTVYRDSPAVISSTESISGSDVSDPSVEDVAIISREAVGCALPVCCAVKVLPEDE